MKYNQLLDCITYKNTAMHTLLYDAQNINTNVYIIQMQCWYHSYTVNIYNNLPNENRLWERIVENEKKIHIEHRYSYRYHCPNLLCICSVYLIISTTEHLLKPLIYFMVHIRG